MAAVPYGELPFGIRDCKITPWTNSTTLGAFADLPRIRSIEVNVTRDSADLDGDDVRIATHSFGKAVEGSIEAGGINLTALVALAGGTAGPEVPGPPKTTTYIVQGNDVEGYCKIEGQMVSDDKGDLHIIVWRAKVTNGPNHTFSNGEYALTSCDYVGVYDASVTPSRLYSLVQTDAVTAIT